MAFGNSPPRLYLPVTRCASEGTADANGGHWKIPTTRKNTVKFLVNQLPDDAKWWVEHLPLSARSEIDRLLRETGIENFAVHWKDHKADLEDIERSFAPRS